VFGWLSMCCRCCLTLCVIARLRLGSTHKLWCVRISISISIPTAISNGVIFPITILSFPFSSLPLSIPWLSPYPNSYVCSISFFPFLHLTLSLIPMLHPNSTPDVDSDSDRAECDVAFLCLIDSPKLEPLFSVSLPRPIFSLWCSVDWTNSRSTLFYLV
jgi:hypothetical protein